MIERAVARVDTPSPEKPEMQTQRCSFVRRTLGVVAAGVLFTVAACSGGPARNGVPDSGEALESSLPVAAAALAAGQPEVARRLYLSLAERFEGAPEPVLGLAYIAFAANDFGAAEKHFVEASSRARKAAATRAEALLGAGRAALAQERAQSARKHFERARKPGRGTPSAPWIENGLAVAATLEGDYTEAEAAFAEALRLAPGDPRISANFVRMLLGAGRTEEAVRLHAEHSSSRWVDDDYQVLRRLIEDARRESRNADAANGVGPFSGAMLGLTCAQLGGDSGSMVPASRELPDQRLALRLSAFGAPVKAWGSEETPPERDFAPRASSLALRLGDWPGPRAPLQVVNCLAPPTEPPPPEAPHVDATLAADDADSAHSLSEEETYEGQASDLRSVATLILSLGQSTRLALARRATSVVVASPDIADVQLSAPNMLHIIAKGVGRTSISALNGDWVEEQVVLVVIDAEPLRVILAGEPDLEGVHIHQLVRGVVLDGEVASAEAVDRALRLAAAALPEGVPIENGLRITTPQQVNLEVQIAEVNRSVTEDLGINWESFGVKSSERFGFRVGRFLPPVAGEELGLDAFPPTVAGVDTASSIFFGSKGPLGQFRVMIDALATAGLANVLARPNVTAASGESASFFSGGEYPLPTGFEDGVIIFEYKKYGVLLDFVPTVVDADRIVLSVRPEVSEPSLNQSVQIVGVEIPVINVRRAETTVEVGNGESIVIAGLFRNASNTVETGVTGLKDMPLLGKLFGKTSIRSDELELIVVVTARLVQSGRTPDRPDAAPSSASRRTGGYHY